ncbi:hypothetical protein, partial [Klebsiella pneumoniae]|uniref:hypothetical protein n=1 Tax=Klebsiella pneumoniae TaxID=573 RepID=UPI001952D8D7
MILIRSETAEAREWGFGQQVRWVMKGAAPAAPRSIDRGERVAETVDMKTARQTTLREQVQL